jgi:hypothetical protein
MIRWFSNQGFNFVAFANFPVHVKGKGAQERQLKEGDPVGSGRGEALCFSPQVNQVSELPAEISPERIALTIQTGILSVKLPSA